MSSLVAVGCTVMGGGGGAGRHPLSRGGFTGGGSPGSVGDWSGAGWPPPALSPPPPRSSASSSASVMGIACSWGPDGCLVGGGRSVAAPPPPPAGANSERMSFCLAPPRQTSSSSSASRETFFVTAVDRAAFRPGPTRSTPTDGFSAAGSSGLIGGGSSACAAKNCLSPRLESSNPEHLRMAGLSHFGRCLVMSSRRYRSSASKMAP